MNTLLINFVAYYATRVRGALGDLSQEVVDGLTDGLEADLIDALEESRHGKNAEELTLNDLIDRFGQPNDYAEELRTAAGFEPGDSSVRPSTPSVVQRLRVWAGGLFASAKGVAQRVGENDTVRRVLQLLRPLWWVWRGIVAYALISLFTNAKTNFPLPQSFGTLVLLVLLIAGSLHLGTRAKAKQQRPRERIAVWVANAVLIVMAIPTAVEISNQQYQSYAPVIEQPGILESFGGSTDWGAPEQWNETKNFFGEQGAELSAPVMIDGALVSNLYVYDAQGNPIEQTQILDQDGRPLKVSTTGTMLDRTTGKVHMWVPAVDEYGRAVPNAFPGNTWTLSSETKYCTPQDRDIWATMLAGQAWVQEDGLLYGADVMDPIAQITSPHAEAIGFSSFWELRSDQLSSGDGCFMGVKIPERTGPTLFPVERLAPLKAYEAPDADANSDAGAGSDAVVGSDGAQADGDKPDGELDAAKPAPGSEPTK